MSSPSSPPSEPTEPFSVVRPKRFTLEERNRAIRAIISGCEDGNLHSEMAKDLGMELADPVPATAVMEAWSEYLRGRVPPCGWLAVWDMKSSDGGGEVPVCVDVLAIDFEGFEAKVQVVDAPSSFSSLMDDEVPM